ncbi:hypothetical protein Dsin_023028 [Dipteronia sinensis]|uniref:Uncharacterized protein n=1 Tax=Dipteronia sinensis TaxID=43782 RepID=A0AAE0E0C8_9ROSI|nr:hypothetical protein Dsin_023028 [Dipteronia sinensis]
MFALIILEDRRFLDVIRNVDATLDVGGGRIGVGAVVRNDSGVPIFAAGVCLIGGADVDFVEATAIYKGVCLIGEADVEIVEAIAIYKGGPYVLGVKF